MAAMAALGVRSGSLAFARPTEGAANRRFERTGAYGREHQRPFAMQKVVGSSPIIRFNKARDAGFSSSEPMNERRWRPGDVVVRREVLNDGRVWCEIAVIVVCDEPDLLATYIADGSPLRFPPGDWPTPTGLHPWHGKTHWKSPGVLTLQRPGDAYGVWVLWSDAPRTFAGWYVNFQEPFRRRQDGYDTQDLELDLWLPAGGGIRLKDDDILEQRVSEGRFTPDQVVEVRAQASRVADEYEAGEHWWADEWASWEPDPRWPRPQFEDLTP
jgi:Protein of unknown function (DUF402)